MPGDENRLWPELYSALAGLVARRSLLQPGHDKELAFDFFFFCTVSPRWPLLLGVVTSSDPGRRVSLTRGCDKTSSCSEYSCLSCNMANAFLKQKNSCVIELCASKITRLMGKMELGQKTLTLCGLVRDIRKLPQF